MTLHFLKPLHSMSRYETSKHQRTIQNNKRAWFGLRVTLNPQLLVHFEHKTLASLYFLNTKVTRGGGLPMDPTFFFSIIFCFVLLVPFWPLFFLSRLNVVQKETMWSLILYVVCMCMGGGVYVCGNLQKWSLYPHTLMYSHGTWTQWSLGRVAHVTSADVGSKVI